MGNIKKNYHVITVILSFFLGLGASLYIVYNSSLVTEKIKHETSVTVTDVGIADAVEKVYDAVVVVNAYEGESVASSGTGFVYKVDNKKAYILTNAHVIDNKDKVDVTLTNEKQVSAKVEGINEYEDIAVLSIQIKDNIHKAEIGDVDALRVGDTVFAVGAPIDSVYSWTVTRGIISGKDRMVEVSLSSSNTADYVMRVIQTDAAINSGNSGGPLCNSNGEVIGITSLKLVRSGVEGMGFAIPIKTAILTAEEVVKGESKTQPYLGIAMLNISNALYYNEYREAINKSEKTTGVIITEVEKNKSAYKAGLKEKDIIVKLNKEEIKSIAYLRYALYQYKVGDKIEIEFIRDGSLKKVTLTLESNVEKS